MNAESDSDRVVGGLTVAWSAFAVLLGLLTAGYGVLVLSTSALGGAWLAGIGVALLLSGAFATGWARERFGLVPATQRRLVVGFGALAFALTLGFVAANGASFEPGSASGGS